MERDIERENQILKSENSLLKSSLKQARFEIEKLSRENDSLKKMYNNLCKSYAGRNIRNNANCPEKSSIKLDDSFMMDLNRLCKDRKHDSSFILKCMRKLYDGVPTQELQSITACGTDENSIVSHENREIIDYLFKVRLASQDLTDKDMNDRYRRLNGLINNAINNIIRSKVSFIHNFHLMEINSGITRQNYIFIFLSQTTKTDEQVESFLTANIPQQEVIIVDLGHVSKYRITHFYPR